MAEFESCTRLFRPERAVSALLRGSSSVDLYYPLALRKMGPSDYEDAPGITTEQSNDVQRRVQSLMEQQWFPQVCISYATGTRPDKDVPGAGPGMLQAATITHALHNAGIACASGLCVPSGNDWKDFLPKIDSRFSKCEVLILLLSPAFYRSQPCLLEIHKAAKAKRMVMIPLRCAEPLPSKGEQWPGQSMADVLVLDQVQDKLGTINALPPRGCFFDSPSYSTLTISSTGSAA